MLLNTPANHKTLKILQIAARQADTPLGTGKELKSCENWQKPHRTGKAICHRWQHKPDECPKCGVKLVNKPQLPATKDCLPVDSISIEPK
jgi:hypothetical protein